MKRFSDADGRRLQSMLATLRLAADRALPGPWFTDEAVREVHVLDAKGGVVARCPREGDANYVASVDPAALVRLLDLAEALFADWQSARDVRKEPTP